jgi:hypothetical protein
MMLEQLRLMRRIHAEASHWAKATPTPLTRDGYVVTDPLLPTQDCVRLANLALHIAVEHPFSCSLGQSAYVVHRAEGHRPYDKNVVQIMNAQDIDPSLDELFQSQRIEQQFAKYGIGNVTLQSISIQIDRPDSEDKRGFHVDSHYPVVFKSFTYLTPVLNDSNGPYTIIPRSHSDVTKKYQCIARSRLTGQPITNMPSYSDSEAVRICGDVGTTILSIQSAVHKGWMPHTMDVRVALICYLDRQPTRRPFNLGFDLIQSNT